ncbi:glycoside hydrolase family 43 protein [Aestuariimicrobium soli]|uniref:glycoside hydrolase family 43 protein n=1 Tax=Aestuariimicrobium soli TaxID=2035834 RepID=UPI003EBFD3A5
MTTCAHSSGRVGRGLTRPAGRPLRGARAALAVLVALTVAACSPSSQPSPDTPTTTDSTQTQTNATQSQETPMGFTNPVYAFNFPDPQVLRDGDHWVAIATNGAGSNVQTLTSDDLVTWEQADDALPRVAEWSTPGKVWAPEIIAWPEALGGGYRMYYTTRAPVSPSSSTEPVQCVSVASSDTLAGPYTDTSSAPIVCETDEGGSIDASPFVDDDGTAWLYWKNDGNAIDADTWMKVQRLSDDGRSLVGEPTKLFKQDQAWEGPLVEGPAVVKVDGVYHLFYSGNGFWTDQYGVGHAVADAPTGPFTKDPAPLLTSNDVAAGPGHNQLFKVGDQWWTAYHAWPPGAVGDAAQGRQLWLGRVTFDGRKAAIEPPTATMPVVPGH